MVGIRGVEEREGPLAPAPAGPPLPEGTIPIGEGVLRQGQREVSREAGGRWKGTRVVMMKRRRPYHRPSLSCRRALQHVLVVATGVVVRELVQKL